jgi:hypothetical protein
LKRLVVSGGKEPCVAFREFDLQCPFLEMLPNLAG